MTWSFPFSIIINTINMFHNTVVSLFMPNIIKEDFLTDNTFLCAVIGKHEESVSLRNVI